jgi:hypothetical protein
MAKRPSRSKTNDPASPESAQPRGRRSRSTDSTSPAAASAPVSDASDMQAARAEATVGLPAELYPGQAPGAPASESLSMGSEPSEADIRMRAYHRYLERRGHHGTDFEDWLEAERELKENRGHWQVG